MSAPLRILQLLGSFTSDFYRGLSELYARGSDDALADREKYRFEFAHVSPDGVWRFPTSLSAQAIAEAPHRSFAQAVDTIAGLQIDVAIPQMFCKQGMTAARSLLDLLAIPYLGNRAFQMAIAADKATANAIVGAAGVDVPQWQLLRRGEKPRIAAPAVVKPNDADNSEGLTLVTAEIDYAAALRAAFAISDAVLIQEYVPLGREVRCGIVARRGALICLPLEEYFVDSELRPVRRAGDKVRRDAGGGLMLAAKTQRESWIIPNEDPIVQSVWTSALRCYAALGSRQYNLFDFRIDPQGKPWFLESGPYCSFAPHSVIVTMMEAAGTPLRRFFAEAIDDVLGGQNDDEALADNRMTGAL